MDEHSQPQPISEIKRVFAKYVFLDVVRFSHERSTEAQSHIVFVLNELVKSCLRDQDFSVVKTSSIEVGSDGYLLLPTGDGMCIVFFRTEYDLHMRLALRILEGLDVYNEETSDHTKRFQIRIGLNQNTDILFSDITGRPNLAGAGINLASRIMSFADGNQIFVSEAVFHELQPNERYMNRFRAYTKAVKHNQIITAYQFIGDGHRGLNTETIVDYGPRRLDFGMNKVSLYEAVTNLASRRFHPRDSPLTYRQAIFQFDSLLQVAKVLYPERSDLQALAVYGEMTPDKHEFGDAINRLKIALESDKTFSPASVSRSKFGIPDLASFKADLATFAEQELVSCVFMDLDNFKAVNDQYNHTIGDQVIQEAIQIAERSLGGKGKIYHRSGDEILLLLPNFDPQEACAVAERIRRSIEATEFPVIGQGFVTATMGVSTSPNFCKLEQLEATADDAAMKTKKLGKNQVMHGSGIQVTERIHQSTLVEIYDAHDRTLSQLEASTHRIELLNLLLGRSDAMYFLLDNRRWSDNDNAGVQLAKSEIEYYEADIWNTLQDRYGTSVAEEHFGKLGKIPEDLLSQRDRIMAHRNKLHGLLQSERAQRLQITLKETEQKQEILKRFVGA